MKFDGLRRIEHRAMNGLVPESGRYGLGLRVVEIGHDILCRKPRRLRLPRRVCGEERLTSMRKAAASLKQALLLIATAYVGVFVLFLCQPLTGGAFGAILSALLTAFIFPLYFVSLFEKERRRLDAEILHFLALRIIGLFGFVCICSYTAWGISSGMMLRPDNETVQIEALIDLFGMLIVGLPIGWAIVAHLSSRER